MAGHGPLIAKAPLAVPANLSVSSSADPAIKQEPRFQDRLGVRLIRTDAQGESVEAFRPCAEIAGMRESIHERVGRLAKFRQARFVPVRGVEVSQEDLTAVEIVSDHVPGIRLSQILDAAAKGRVVIETGAALLVVRELLGALALFHESRGVTHGAIGPERILVTTAGRIMVTDYVLGLALERLNIPKLRLWTEFRIPMPVASAKASIDVRTDIAQIGVVATALLLGRLLEAKEYPRRIPDLIESLSMSGDVDRGQPLPATLRTWLKRVLAIETHSQFVTAREAQMALEGLLSKRPKLQVANNPFKRLVAACLHGWPDQYATPGSREKGADSVPPVLIAPALEADAGTRRRIDAGASLSVAGPGPADVPVVERIDQDLAAGNLEPAISLAPEVRPGEVETVAPAPVPQEELVEQWAGSGQTPAEIIDTTWSPTEFDFGDASSAPASMSDIPSVDVVPPFNPVKIGVTIPGGSKRKPRLSEPEPVRAASQTAASPAVAEAPPLHRDDAARVHDLSDPDDELRRLTLSELESIHADSHVAATPADAGATARPAGTVATPPVSLAGAIDAPRQPEPVALESGPAESSVLAVPIETGSLPPQGDDVILAGILAGADDVQLPAVSPDAEPNRVESSVLAEAFEAQAPVAHAELESPHDVESLRPFLLSTPRAGSDEPTLAPIPGIESAISIGQDYEPPLDLGLYRPAAIGAASPQATPSLSAQEPAFVEQEDRWVRRESDDGQFAGVPAEARTRDRDLRESAAYPEVPRRRSTPVPVVEKGPSLVTLVAQAAFQATRNTASGIVRLVGEILAAVGGLVGGAARGSASLVRGTGRLLVSTATGLAGGIARVTLAVGRGVARALLATVRGVAAGATRLAGAVGGAVLAAGSITWRAMRGLAHGVSRATAAGLVMLAGGARVAARGGRSAAVVLLKALAALARFAAVAGRVLGKAGWTGLVQGGTLATRALRATGRGAIAGSALLFDGVVWLARGTARIVRPARRAERAPADQRPVYIGIDRPAPRMMRRWQYFFAVLMVPVALHGIEVAKSRWFDAASQSGTLRIDSAPHGLSVRIDGVAFGTTPLSTSLSAGRHRVELSGPKASRVHEVDVQAGTTTTLGPSTGTAAPTGSLRVESQPAGAEVWIDGVRRGKAPATIESLAVGAHTVVVRSESGSVTKGVRVQADQTAELVMPIYSGWVAVFAPVELNIIEGGRLIGSTEGGHVMLQPGEHSLELVSDRLGFRSTRKVVVLPGEVAALNMQLPPAPLEVVAPAGAEVRIDGQLVGTAPLGPLSVAVGTREVSVRLLSAGEQRQTMTITYRSPNKVIFE